MNDNNENACPYCGSKDFYFDEKEGVLVCNYCRRKFKSKNSVIHGVNEIEKLEGEKRGKAAGDIDNSQNLVTLKCGSCGAEIIVDSNEAFQARCHWCRNTLSINQKLPNGAIPDMVLPFKVSKEEAFESMKNYVKKYKFYASKDFTNQLKLENIIGVYFPYMLVDINSHAKLKGQAEFQAARHVDSHNNVSFDADVYNVEREFDLYIDDLTIESNSDKLDIKQKEKTNNIINAIMPFDTENCVEWNANYLKGFNSEKRDLNVDELKDKVDDQVKDIARHSVNDTLKFYDRGVRWDEEQVDIKGRGWETAYLPVWLYNYQEKDKNGNVVKEHYVAVNGRTKETKGSIPLNRKKLYLVILLFILLFPINFVAILTTILTGRLDVLFMIIPFIFVGLLFIVYEEMKYRNINERHYYERDTKFKTANIKYFDRAIKREFGLTSTKIKGANNEELDNYLFPKKKKNKFRNYLLNLVPYIIVFVILLWAISMLLILNKV